MLFSSKSRTLLGLDITTSSVKLIELGRSGSQFRVESYAAEATPQNAVNEKAVVDPASGLREVRILFENPVGRVAPGVPGTLVLPTDEGTGP